MKKLNYLLVAVIMFAFAACGGEENKSESTLENNTDEDKK